MKVKGLGLVLKQLKQLNTDTKNGVVRALEATGLEALDKIDSFTPVDNGKLRQGSGQSVNKDRLTLTLFNNVPYAPYVEFGTGARVDVPAELQDVAIQFKGGKGGSFDDLLANIKLWCKRKGIDEKLAYIIAVSIIKKGLHPQPFLYPAYQFGQRKFIQLISNLIKSVK